MCWRCAVPVRLSRRSFHKSVLAATVMDPSCLVGGTEALVEPEMRLAVPAGSPRTVALTLDACGGGTDLRILDALLAMSVPATIFVTGLWLRNNSTALSVLLGRPDLFALQN